MTIFEQIKSAIDMKTVAETYGLHINRAGMAVCPFHDEKTPSAKIYPYSFHCFGCGIHLDAVGFTQKYFNLERPIDAVKKLNQDFGLNLAIGQAPTIQEQNEYQKRMAEKREYEVWEKSAWKTLHDYLWLMREWRKLAPVSQDDVPDKRFVYSLHHLDYADYLCDEFLNADKAEKLDMKSNISAAADFMKNGIAEFENCGIF